MDKWNRIGQGGAALVIGWALWCVFEGSWVNPVGDQDALRLSLASVLLVAGFMIYYKED